MFKKAISLTLAFTLTLAFVPTSAKARNANSSASVTPEEGSLQIKSLEFPDVTFFVTMNIETKTSTLSWTDGVDVASIGMQVVAPGTHKISVLLNNISGSATVKVQRESPLVIDIGTPDFEFGEFLAAGRALASHARLGPAFDALAAEVRGDRKSAAIFKQMCPDLVRETQNADITAASMESLYECSSGGAQATGAVLFVIGSVIIGSAVVGAIHAGLCNKFSSTTEGFACCFQNQCGQQKEEEGGEE
jgi:hypothetical protein